MWLPTMVGLLAEFKKQTAGVLAGVAW